MRLTQGELSYFAHGNLRILHPGCHPPLCIRRSSFIALISSLLAYKWRFFDLFAIGSSEDRPYARGANQKQTPNRDRRRERRTSSHIWANPGPHAYRRASIASTNVIVRR
jgi:hypothetical protein